MYTFVYTLLVSSFLILPYYVYYPPHYPPHPYLSLRSCATGEIVQPLSSNTAMCTTCPSGTYTLSKEETVGVCMSFE